MFFRALTSLFQNDRVNYLVPRAQGVENPGCAELAVPGAGVCRASEWTAMGRFTAALAAMLIAALRSASIVMPQTPQEKRLWDFRLDFAM